MVRAPARCVRLPHVDRAAPTELPTRNQEGAEHVELESAPGGVRAPSRGGLAHRALAEAVGDGDTDQDSGGDLAARTAGTRGRAGSPSDRLADAPRPIRRRAIP